MAHAKKIPFLELVNFSYDEVNPKTLSKASLREIFMDRDMDVNHLYQLPLIWKLMSWPSNEEEAFEVFVYIQEYMKDQLGTYIYKSLETDEYLLEEAWKAHSEVWEKNPQLMREFFFTEILKKP